MLGGKDNFAADRAAGDAVMAAYPGIVESVRANRARVVVACLIGVLGVQVDDLVGVLVPDQLVDPLACGVSRAAAH